MNLPLVLLLHVSCMVHEAAKIDYGALRDGRVTEGLKALASYSRQYVYDPLI